MKRMTVGDLKKALKGLPDQCLISLQSDSEGNQESTLLDWFVVQIGTKHSWKVTDNGPEHFYVDGDETYGVDLKEDNGKYMLVLTPSL